MAERRMFSKTIIDSDAFLEMPLSTQALYFHLSMRADDDGFVNNPKKIQRMIGASEDDLKLLIAKSFLITFDTGIVVIKHWRIHNYIRADRKHDTKYTEELSMLNVKENGAYTTCQPNDCQVVNQLSDKRDTEVRLGKDRLGKDSIDNNTKPSKKKYGEYNHVLLTDEEYSRLINDYEEPDVIAGIKKVDEYCQETGKRYKDYNLTLRRWGITAQKKVKVKEPEVVIDPEEEARQKAWEEGFYDA